MLFAVAGLALALVMGSAADVKGKWDGTITGQRPDGTTSEDTALLILDQKDSTITGTVGGTSPTSIRSSAGQSTAARCPWSPRIRGMAGSSSSS